VIGYEGADGGFLRDLDVVLERVVEAERQVLVGMYPALTLTGSVATSIRRSTTVRTDEA
jgi:hypothetical protein